MEFDAPAVKASFQEAVRDLGSTQTEIAELAGITRQTLSALLSGGRYQVTREQRLMIQVCRRGLMVKAALLGRSDAELVKYTEAAVFGLPEVDPAIVVPEARALAEQVRAQRSQMRGAA